MKEICGILLINKPVDWTSHDVVAYIRGVTRIRQIGHTGTLDPFATGLLILLIDSATKQADSFHKFAKTYQALVKLGVETDTYDRTGKIVAENTQLSPLPIELIKEGLEKFKGEIQQVPPAFSAKKIKGKKAYDFARKSLEIELKPNTITIHEIIIDDYSFPFLKLTITCSTGTYIRSLAHDLGKELEVGATLWELERTKIGPYDVKNSTDPKSLNKESWQNLLLSLP